MESLLFDGATHDHLLFQPCGHGVFVAGDDLVGAALKPLGGF